MSIATTTQYWTSRMNGGNPAALTAYGQDNLSFTLTGSESDGSALGSNWQISNDALGQYWSVLPTSDAYTIVAALKFNTAPANDTVLMELDNGSFKVQVKATGDLQTLKLVGATTATITDLDLGQADAFDSVPIMVRLTMDSAGKAKMYCREIIEDDTGIINYLQVDGATGSGATVKWGNDDGVVIWNNVYVSTFGAFSPDELSTSPFVTDSLMRMALSIVDLLQNSNRFYLKNQVGSASILYGYDISSQMISRIPQPSVHVILRKLDSPDFATLGGTKIEQNYTVILFVTTRGTDYKNAYRMGMEIAGDCFDELYTNTGLLGNTDSLTNYEINFDTKMDNDEVVCVHRLEVTYMRRLNMLHR